MAGFCVIVGGGFSELPQTVSTEIPKFLGALATAKTRSAPVRLQPSPRAAWLHRWRGLLACTAARSFVEFLLVETVFGQSVFGHPYLTIFGQSIFGQSIFGQNWCFSGFTICAPRRLGPERWGPRRVGGRKISLLFSLSRTVFCSFCLSLGLFSLNFHGFCDDRDPQLCTFGLSNCRVKLRRPRSSRSFTRQPESKNVHI